MEKSKRFLKVLAQPLTNAMENSVAGQPRRAWRFGPFRYRKEQQAGGGREGRSMCRLGQSADPRRPAEPHLLIEDVAGQLARPMQLTGAPRQHNPPAGDFIEPPPLAAAPSHRKRSRAR